MEKMYLHNHPEFGSLLNIIGSETGILPGLIEKDYWIMHVLYSIKKQGFQFELKGGTSLSKGFGIIDRFSEDIDIHIHPNIAINTNPNKRNPEVLAERELFYDELAKSITTDGIVSITRDKEFDSRNLLSGGIRLTYGSISSPVEGVKEGILLEAGFDNVTPYFPRTISSWAFEKASTIIGATLIDNRATDIPCYHPGYTFVEKLQTIATKYRREQETGIKSKNFMRQYYDVAMLLIDETVNSFIGTEDYKAHKALRFPAVDLAVPISENDAFLLSNPEIYTDFKHRYIQTAGLYYKGQKNFDEIIEVIRENTPRL